VALATVYDESPVAGVRLELRDSPRGVTLDPRLLLPEFVASPWGSVLSRVLDVVVGADDWRAPLPPLVSARVDDVTGARGLTWLAPLEATGIRPSIGTLHDVWLASGRTAVEGVVAASRRGASVSPHAFDMDRFIWFDAPRGRAFPAARMEEHRTKLEADVRATGLVLGKTLNAHFDVVGDTGAAAAFALGFRYLLGEHSLGQDWRAPPRARDPLGTPLYAYGPAGPFFGYQAQGAIASSAARRSRYDWLRNFMELDPRTGLPLRESLDRTGAIGQGATQLLAALHAGFPGYLLAHEVHLDALGGELVGELLDAVLALVRERVPGVKTTAFDELARSCGARSAEQEDTRATGAGTVPP
jgi:hypothetical protein